MEETKNLFKLPAPLSHYKAIVGSAHIVPDAWKKFGVMVTLETGQLFCIQTYDSKREADDLAAWLNRCKAE